MLMPLIVTTVLAGAGWLLLARLWRGREPAHYGRGNDGLLASSRRGVLPALLGVTAFLLSGRPQFLVPPSVRSRRVMAMESGRPGGGLVPGTHQAGRLDHTGSYAALQPGETLHARIMANRVQGGRAYGGHVTVTSNRLVFEPVRASQANGGARWGVPLTQVTSADVAPRGWNARTGAWRHRLRVRTMTGDVEYFVVWRPRRAAGLVERARQNQP